MYTYIQIILETGTESSHNTCFHKRPILGYEIESSRSLHSMDIVFDGMRVPLHKGLKTAALCSSVHIITEACPKLRYIFVHARVQRSARRVIITSRRDVQSLKMIANEIVDDGLLTSSSAIEMMDEDG